ncbi:MAG: hypothetical protein QOI11_427 [Candidatus Eremiobacteraeota bacterium]|jgi:hypothetical protein|nr:hypothetical protein [Candidatus Eremiobacteraeota bacterium]
MIDRGVVTLADSNYYPGLLQLHASIQSSDSPCPVLCYDVGLTAAQREDASRRHDLQVLELPGDPLIAELIEATRDYAPLPKPGKRIWPLWICPLLIRAAPLRDVFWLDCDVVVLRDLGELFGMLADGPVFTPENKAPQATPNSPSLYAHLPIRRQFDPQVPVVNGGVSGWRRGRDDAALEAYVRPVAAAARDRAVRDAISWHDQGALIWAIQSLGLEDRVLTTPMWNLCVDNAPVPAETLAWNDGLLERLRAALPEVKLLHWNGRKNPWLVP